MLSQEEEKLHATRAGTWLRRAYVLPGGKRLLQGLKGALRGGVGGVLGQDGAHLQCKSPCHNGCAEVALLVSMQD